MNSERSVAEKKKNAMLWVFVITILLMGVKFLAYHLTQSVAILTDAFESIVNVLATGFAWYAVTFASVPKDEDHPYGHGKIEFFSSGFEGGLIIMAGGFILHQSIINLMNPQPIGSLPEGMALLALTGVVNAIMARMLIKKGKLWSSITLEADGKHLGSDAWSTFIVIFGVGLVLLTGYQMLDSLLAMGFSFLLFWQGVGLIRKSVSGLMDAADPTSIELIAGLLSKHRKSDWIDIHNLRIQRYGADLHVDCHFTFPYYYTLEQTHERMDEVEKLLKGEFDHKLEIFIHTDPCIPDKCCNYCRMTTCAVRKKPFDVEYEWTLQRLTTNHKHYLSGKYRS